MPDKTFEIAIKTTADPSGAQQIDGELQKLKEEAGSTASHGVASGSSFDDTAEQTSLREQLTTQQAISAQTTEQIALETRRASIMTQRQILVDIELEKTQALVAGDTARVAVLEADLELRKVALQLQTSAGLSETEATGIATTRLAMEAQITFELKLQALAAASANEGNLLAGVNIGKARQEATVLGRELLTGGNTTRTLGSLLGALGPAILPVVGGAIALYGAMRSTTAVAQELGELFGGFTLKDLGSGLNPEAIAKEITAADQLKQALAAINNLSFSQLEGQLEKSGQKLTELTDKYREALLEHDGLLEPIFGKNEKIRTSLLEQVNAEKERNSLLQLAANVAQALETLEAEKTEELKRQLDVLRQAVAAQTEQTKLAGEFKKAFEDSLSGTEKLDLWKTRITEINRQLQDLGVSANSPNEAMAKSIGLSDEQKVAIDKLALEWQKLTGEILKTSDTETAAAAKSAEHHREQIDALNKELAAMKDKRTALTTELAATTDPAKHAALQKEVEDLNLQLLIKQKIKTATDDAAAAGKKWTDGESKALETEISGPLQAKLKILQELVGLGDAGAQKKIDALTGKPKPPTLNNAVTDDAGNTINYDVSGPTVPPVKDADYYRQQLAQNPDDTNSKAELTSLLQKQEADIKTVTTTAATAATKAMGDVGKDTSDGLTTIAAATTATADTIAPLFNPIAKSIQTDIPQAISTGLDSVSGAVIAGIAGMAASFARTAAALQSQIDSLWQNKADN